MCTSPMASANVSPPRRASFDAPLVRSSAIPRIASSTVACSMLHPLVIRREAGDAYADPTFEEIPRVTFCGPTTHVVQLAEDAVLADRSELVPDDSGPRRVRRHHRLDRGCRRRVGAVMAEGGAAWVEGVE